MVIFTLPSLPGLSAQRASIIISALIDTKKPIAWNKTQRIALFQAIHEECLSDKVNTVAELVHLIYWVLEGREREFIGTNIKQFHAKIKLRRWDTEKNLQNRLSPLARLEGFRNFYRGLKLMAELVRI